jgi:hypothetical protein
MGKINWNRVIIGGLVAGAIINIFEFALHGFVLAQDMDAAVKALGREVGGGELLMFLAWGFLVGIFAVWLYAAIRPRYGAGPKTALCAGAAVWGLGYLLASVTPIALQLFPRHVMAIGLALTFAHIQQRDGRWCIVDLVGKHGRVRTIPMPTWVKVAIDAWTTVAGLADGRVFRPVNRGGKLQGEAMSEKVVWQMLQQYATDAGVPGIAPHDCRRYAESRTMPNRYKGSKFGGCCPEPSRED